MDLKLDENQQMLRDSARDFLKTECPKKVVREIEEGELGYSPSLWKKMAGLEWMGVIVPEEYGGVGWGLLELAVLFEEIGRAAMPGPMFATMMGTLALLEAGSPEQKQDLLPKVASGELLLTVATDEPNALCDPTFANARAARRDNGFEINGTKLMVPYAHVAAYMITAVRTNGEPGDETGITLFIIDRKLPGIHMTPVPTLASDRRCQMEFKNVAAPAENMLGDPDQGFRPIQAVLAKATAIQCAEAIGGAQQELEMTAAYTRGRIQFDRPIGTFQAVQHRLADMHIDTQSARLTTYQAVSRLNEGLDASREVAIAKGITGRAVQRVAVSAQQLHGGIGVDLDYDLHFYFRRAKAIELTLGTPAFHFRALGSRL